MKLYLYYVSDGKLIKEVNTGVRETKYQYVIPECNGHYKQHLRRLRKYYIDKSECNIPKVGDPFRRNPHIISERSDLDQIEGLERILLEIQRQCWRSEKMIEVWKAAMEKTEADGTVAEEAAEKETDAEPECEADAGEPDGGA